MTKDIFDEKFKKFTKDLVEKYRVMTFTGEYELDVKFNKKNKDNRVADIAIDTRYLNATLTVYKLGYEEYKKRGREDYAKIILHEICHLLTEPQYDDILKLYNGKMLLKDTIEDTRERQTQRITNALWESMRKNNK